MVACGIGEPASDRPGQVVGDFGGSQNDRGGRRQSAQYGGHPCLAQNGESPSCAHGSHCLMSRRFQVDSQRPIESFGAPAG